MIEIGLGLLLTAGALVVLTGAGGMLGSSSIDVFPLLGYGGTGLILALGLLLVSAGLTRRAIARNPETRYGLRTARLTVGGLLMTAVLAIGLPLAAEPFNLVRVEGFPAGYYLAAQGALIALVILAFSWSARQNRIDAEEQGDD